VGTNGAFFEDVGKSKKLMDSSAIASGDKMIVNTEWGAFNGAVGYELAHLHYLVTNREGLASGTRHSL
jgi:hexokinase